MPSSISPVQSLKGRVAVLHRDHDPNSTPVVEARRDLAAAKIEQYIRRIVADAPPLTAEQRDRLATILRGAR